MALCNPRFDLLFAAKDSLEKRNYLVERFNDQSWWFVIKEEKEQFQKDETSQTKLWQHVQFTCIIQGLFTISYYCANLRNR